MHIHYVIFLFLTLLSLSACASTAQYEAAETAKDKGFREVKIESNRYRVTYRGGERAVASDYALKRAADITLREGYEWFEVVSEDVDVTQTRSGPSTSIGIGGSSGRRSGVGVGIGIGIPIGGGRNAESYAVLEIILGRGPKPEGRQFYDARSVAANIK